MSTYSRRSQKEEFHPDLPASTWTDYSRKVQTVEDTWGLTQKGDLLLFDEAFEWTRPLNLTKPEHIQKWLHTLNEKVKSFVAEDGYIYLAVTWKKGDYTWEPRYFRFKWDNTSEPFFVVENNRWGKPEFSVRKGLESWTISKSKNPRMTIPNLDTIPDEDLREAIKAMFSGQPLSPHRMAILQQYTPQQLEQLVNTLKPVPVVSYIRAYGHENDTRGPPRFNFALSRYYRQPKHREGLYIFRPSGTEALRHLSHLGILNWSEFLV